MFKSARYFKPKFKPTNDLYIVPLGWLLVVAALSSATFLATASRGGLYFILYALLGATVFGVLVPTYWEIIKNKKKPGDLGITTKGLIESIIIQIVLFAVLYYSQLSLLTENKLTDLAPFIALALAIGFFEALFWRGWMINKLEESFGTIPAVILGSALYSLYHVGYGMKMDEMVFLFFVGLMFAVIFVITRNIFALWPLFQPYGQLLTITKDEGFNLPFIATVGFFEALFAMVLIIFFLNKYKTRSMKKIQHKSA